MKEEDLLQSQNQYLKMLVADDEEIIRVRLKELGEKLGFSVKAAKDGGEAWEIFKTWRPDLVVIDIYMPCMNGLTVLHKIKTASPDTPIIMITGFLHYEQLIQKDRVKPDGFITKPFHMEEIANMMLELVEGHTAAAEI